jgi:hypothetical protein
MTKIKRQIAKIKDRKATYCKSSKKPSNKIFGKKNKPIIHYLKYKQKKLEITGQYQRTQS